MYNRIVNPETNRLVSLRTSKGKQILRNYINQLGGENIYRCPSIKAMLYTGIEGECLGTDEGQAHRFHPNCAIRTEKEKKLDIEEEYLGTDEEQSHRFHPNYETRVAEQEK